MLPVSNQPLRSARMAPNLAQPPDGPIHREWTDDGRQHLPANMLDGGFDNEAFHRQMVAILAEWRTGYRTLFALILMSAGLAGCAVGPDFVAPSQPRETNYVMGQAATVSTPASGDATQQIHLGGVLEADWWTRLRSPELDRTVTLALSSNRTLEVARANLSKASEEIKVARAGLLPQLDATGGLARQQYGAYFLGPEAATFPAFSAYTGGVGVSYDLDVFGRTRRSIELAAADKDVQQEALRAAQLSIAGDTVLEALQIASTRAQIDVVNSVVASDQRTLGLVQARLAAGAASDQDVTTAQSQLDRDRTLLPALHQQLDMAQDALATLVGSSPADWSAPDFSLAGMSLPQDVPLVVPSELVRSRPDIRAAEAQLHAASAAGGYSDGRSLSSDQLERQCLPNRVYLPGRQVLPGASSAGSPRRSFTAGPSPQSGAPRRTPTRLRSRNISRRC